MQRYEGKILIFDNVRWFSIEKRSEMPVNKLKNCHGIFDRVIIESMHTRVSLCPKERDSACVCIWKNREDARFFREESKKKEEKNLLPRMWNCPYSDTRPFVVA